MLKIYVDFNSIDRSDPGKEFVLLPMKVQQDAESCKLELSEGGRVVIYDEDISFEALLRRRKSELWAKNELWMAEIIEGTLQEESSPYLPLTG